MVRGVASTELLLFSKYCVFMITGSDVISNISAEATFKIVFVCGQLYVSYKLSHGVGSCKYASFGVCPKF